MAIKATALEFNPKHPKYQCLCGIMPAKVGAIVFGILEAIGLALTIIIGAYILAALGQELDHGPYTREYGLDSGFVERLSLPIILFLIPLILVMVYFFMGIAKNKSSFLIPHLFLQVCSLIMLYVYVVIVLWGLIELKVISDKIDAAEIALEEGDRERMDEHGHHYRTSTFNGHTVTFTTHHIWAHFMHGCWGTVFLWISSALFQYWRLRVVYSYYTFCKDKEEWERNQVNCVTMIRDGMDSGMAPPVYAEQQHLTTAADNEKQPFSEIPIV